jgi:adenylate cyclase, class 2
MKFEVEQKHRVDDPDALLQKLAERGAALGPEIEQCDTYFAHPCRDFAQTDEALRIRVVAGECCVTYKGPKLDAATKTRREIELPLAAGEQDWTELLMALGFQPVTMVRKSRRPFELEHHGAIVHGAWDVVNGVGTFVELELTADQVSLDSARAIVKSLSDELQLGPSERRSYLEMLLDVRGRNS